jgi:CubicO group peptidase (beta-lactamase class C family)
MGAVLVSRNYELLINKGYGYANLEWNIPNTPSTKFRLGSLTKQFTAVAILLLEQQGKLKLTDPIKSYMGNTPAAWDNISVYHLLTHTSGIPNYTSFPEFPSMTTTHKTPVQQIALFRDKPLDSLPGSSYAYSNSDYVLLGYIIEQLSGFSYQNFVTENIFKYLGMSDSGYDSHAKIIPLRASGYIKTPKGMQNADYLDMSIPYSAGALYSTVKDLDLWQQGIFGEKILSATSLKKLTTPNKNSYCLGVVNQSFDGYPVIHHAGGINGFGTILIYSPKDKLVITALSNLNAYGYVYQDIAMKILYLMHGKKVLLSRDRKSVSISKELLKRYTGTYKLTSTNEAYSIYSRNLEIRLEGHQLIGQIENNFIVSLYPESATQFFGVAPDVHIEFKKGCFDQLKWRQDEEDYIATRQ